MATGEWKWRELRFRLFRHPEQKPALSASRMGRGIPRSYLFHGIPRLRFTLRNSARDDVSLARDFFQHLRVRRELANETQQPLDGFLRLVAGESATNHVDFVKLVGGHEQLLA